MSRLWGAALALLAIGCRPPEELGGPDLGVPAFDLPPAPPSPSDHGCPEPPAIGPETLPVGFLPPVVVDHLLTVDGDTAHFAFPDAGRQVARFLYIDTEENHGVEATDFGEQTAQLVRAMLEGATEVAVAVEEDRYARGQPHTDPFDRWLSLIFVDGELLQTRIVREGLSAYYTRFGCAPPPIHDSLLFAEAEARAAGRGIWAPGHPTDYAVVLEWWIGKQGCRPNPFKEPYCP